MNLNSYKNNAYTNNDNDDGQNNNGEDGDEDPDELEMANMKKRLELDYDNEIENLADHVSNLLGNRSAFNCGLYQLISFVFISIAWTIGTGWYSYVSVFSGYTPNFKCDVSSMNGNTGSTSYITQNENDLECSAFNNQTNETLTCTKWLYESDQMKETLISEYNLVCDRDYYFETAYSIEQSGYIVGTLLFSYLADRIGRKKVLMGVLIGMCVLGFIQTYLKNFFAFFAIGFFINALACGVDATCITLILEMFSTSKRTFFGVGIEVFWVIVMASLSPLTYFVGKWREIRLIIFVVLSLTAALSYFCVQESIRWLISTNKLDLSLIITDKIAKFNKLTKKPDSNYLNERKKLENVLKVLNEVNSNRKKQQSSRGCSMNDSSSLINQDRIIDIFKNSKFRLYVLIMALNWFATSLVYDGLTYLNNFVGENIFVNWVLMNLIELPAQFVCYVIISKYGRRISVCLTLVLAGIALLLTCACNLIDALKGIEWLKTILFVLAKFSITQSYSAIIIHAPELFPTNLRSFGYGISLFSGKVTSVISPMISLYLGKVFPNLPSIIYGTISILCGFVSLYVPETLNRPLPNSIRDVIKWPRSLTKDEWNEVDKLNKIQFKWFYKFLNAIKSVLSCKKRQKTINNSSSINQSISATTITTTITSTPSSVNTENLNVFKNDEIIYF